MVDVHLVVTQRNRARSIPWSLGTVLSQAYKHLRVTYVDDASTDESRQVIESVLSGATAPHPSVHLVTNASRQGVIANILPALKDDSDDTVAVLLDGDDGLAHPFAIDRIAYEYTQDVDCWFTYGSFLSWPDRQVIYDGAYHPECLKENHFRRWFWRCAPPARFELGYCARCPANTSETTTARIGSLPMIRG